MKTVVMIGGGIGGLTAALCLRSRGVEGMVYERAPTFAEAGAAITLWPNATRILRRIGVLEVLQSCGHEAASGGGLICDWGGRPLKRLEFSSADAPTLFLHRAELLAALQTAVADGHVVTGKTFQHSERDGARIRAVFSDGSTSVWADGLVGADGIHSAVRAQWLHDGEPEYRGYVAWRGIARWEGEAVATETWGRGKRFGLVPIGNHRIGWWAAANVASPERTVLRNTPAMWKTEVLRLFGSSHFPIPELVQATPDDRVLCHMIQDRSPPPTSPPLEGPITLLGDAAHPTTPNLGQGACMAIEDSAVLAHAVEAIPDSASAFRVYEATRAERTRRISVESRRLGSIGQWRNPLACMVRNTLFRASSTPALRRRLEELWTYDAWNAPLMMPS
jgi:2-polyprenyl-6-methoxyphenol hydroxylase-like FAD-dependent oxidoreductase